jgi:NAD-dependent deacetylase
MNPKIETFRDMFNESGNIVFFGGAGVSTESGIPDFRSVDGLYNQKYKYPPETILSRSFFERYTADFYDFYKAKLLHLAANPNNAHIALAKAEKAGKVRAVVTQNIDGLHQKAGSGTVIELHGSVWRNFCMDCRAPYDVGAVAAAHGIPRCVCGGVIKPDVVLFDETLNENDMIAAMDFIANADMLIIGGTSLSVYPAAGLLRVYRRNKLVIINKSATHMDNRADLVLNESLSDVFSF